MAVAGEWHREVNDCIADAGEWHRQESGCIACA